MIKLNGKEINVTIFPDKTSQVWQLPEESFNSKQFEIEWKFDHEGELFHLQQLVTLLRTGTVPREMTLYLPYLPYGRQDKRVSNNSTFALQVFAENINRLNFNRVITVDAHSNIARDLIKNFEDKLPRESIEKAYLAGIGI